jgi:hypothetical protein
MMAGVHGERCQPFHGWIPRQLGGSERHVERMDVRSLGIYSSASRAEYKSHEPSRRADGPPHARASNSAASPHGSRAAAHLRREGHDGQRRETQLLTDPRRGDFPQDMLG